MSNIASSIHVVLPKQLKILNILEHYVEQKKQKNTNVSKCTTYEMLLLDHSVNYINSEKDDKALPMIRQRKVKVHIINL